MVWRWPRNRSDEYNDNNEAKGEDRGNNSNVEVVAIIRDRVEEGREEEEIESSEDEEGREKFIESRKSP